MRKKQNYIGKKSVLDEKVKIGKNFSLQFSSWIAISLSVIFGLALFLFSSARIFREPVLSSRDFAVPAPMVTLKGSDGSWCFDSGNVDFNIEGVCQDKSGIYHDYCDNKTIVKDYFCTGTKKGSEYKNVHCSLKSLSCPEKGRICLSGKCI